MGHKNKIICKHCNDTLDSTHRHDYKLCSCGKVGVDGGCDYYKRIGKTDDYIELSEPRGSLATDYQQVIKHIHKQRGL